MNGYGRNNHHGPNEIVHINYILNTDFEFLKCRLVQKLKYKE